jgi:hypothetical protein
MGIEYGLVMIPNYHLVSQNSHICDFGSNILAVLVKDAHLSAKVGKGGNVNLVSFRPNICPPVPINILSLGR